MKFRSLTHILHQAPAGVKKNLHRTYDSWSPELVARGNNVNRAQALFVLAWFHAVVQERRTYIPQGWSKFYEFSLADLKAGCDILDRLFKEEGQCLKGLVSVCINEWLTLSLMASWFVLRFCIQVSLQFEGYMYVVEMNESSCKHKKNLLHETKNLNQVSFRPCIKCIKNYPSNYFSGSSDVKWNFVHGLFENAIYGGRVDNVWDSKVLSAYLQIFFNSDVVGGRKPTATHLVKNLTLPTTVNYQVGSHPVTSTLVLYVYTEQVSSVNNSANCLEQKRLD